MSRRVSLPGADELFRSTQGPRTEKPAAEDTAQSTERVEESANGEEAGPEDAVEAGPEDAVEAGPEDAVEAGPEAAAAAERRAPSGRVRHDEKITVYVTSDELLDLERTRLVLRGDHRLAVDRGRIVREAIHLALEGVRDDGEGSALVRRLREQ